MDGMTGFGAICTTISLKPSVFDGIALKSEGSRNTNRRM